MGLSTPDFGRAAQTPAELARPCLLYTSDAADERSSVDLGGRRILKKKKRRVVLHHTERDTEETHKRVS